MRVAIFGVRQRGPAPYNRRSAMHRSKLDIGGADAGAGDMATSSRSSDAVECRLRHRPIFLSWPIPASPRQPDLV